MSLLVIPINIQTLLFSQNFSETQFTSMNADEERTERSRKCWKICYHGWNECSHTLLPSFRHTLAEVMVFIINWL